MSRVKRDCVTRRAGVTSFFYTMSSSTPHITLSILKSYYLSVIDLRTYLNGLLQPSNLDHVQISSPESSYTCLLNTAFVASSQPPNKSFAYFPPNFDMCEVGNILGLYFNSYKRCHPDNRSSSNEII